MNCVLLGSKNQNIRVHKQRKRENKELGETEVIRQTLVAFGDVQQKQKVMEKNSSTLQLVFTVIKTGLHY